MREAPPGWSNVIAALQVLAADADEQLRAFPPYVAVADEIALLLQDALLVYEQDAPAEDALLRAINDLDTTLDGLSGAANATFWSNDSLTNDSRWQRLRETARQLLQQLGIPQRPPRVEDTFIPIDDGSDVQ